MILLYVIWHMCQKADWWPAHHHKRKI